MEGLRGLHLGAVPDVKPLVIILVACGVMNRYLECRQRAPDFGQLLARASNTSMIRMYIM